MNRAVARHRCSFWIELLTVELLSTSSLTVVLKIVFIVRVMRSVRVPIIRFHKGSRENIYRDPHKHLFFYRPQAVLCPIST
jgi:hypothetical protein